MNYIFLFVIIFILLIVLYTIEKKYGIPKFKEYTRQDIENMINHYGMQCTVDKLCSNIIYPHPRTFISKMILLEEFKRLRKGIEGDYEILVDYFDPDCEEKNKYFEDNKRKLVERCVTRYSKLFPELIITLIDENFPKKNRKTVWEYYKSIKQKKVPENGDFHVVDETRSPACMIAAAALDCSYEGVREKCYDAIAELFCIRREHGKNKIEIKSESDVE